MFRLSGNLVPYHPRVVQQPVRLGREDQEALRAEVCITLNIILTDIALLCRSLKDVTR